MPRAGERSARGLGVGLLLVALVLAPEAWARGRGAPPPSGPVLAAHPLVVNEAAPAEVRELQKYWSDLLHHVLRVRAAEEKAVRAALAQEKAGRCFPTEPPCLSRLAKAANAQRAMLVSVNLYPVVVTGVMGEPEQAMAAPRTLVVDRVEIKKGRLRAAKKAVEQMARQLAQGSAEELFAAPAPGPEPVAAAEAATPDIANQDFVPAQVMEPYTPLPEGEPVRVTKESSGGSGRPIGYGLMGLGLAGLGAGTVFYLQSQSALQNYQAQLDEARQTGTMDRDGLAAQKDALRAQQRGVSDRKTWSLALLSVGAASAIVGTVVVLKSGSGNAEPSVAVSVGPAGALVKGNF